MPINPLNTKPIENETTKPPIAPGTQVTLLEDVETPDGNSKITKGTTGTITSFQDKENKYTLTFLTEQYPMGVAINCDSKQFEIVEKELPDALQQVAAEIAQALAI